jgi:hypothetical protein
MSANFPLGIVKSEKATAAKLFKLWQDISTRKVSRGQQSESISDWLDAKFSKTSSRALILPIRIQILFVFPN